MTLSFVQPSADSATLNICLYGPAGSGKTVAACGAPGPVLVINAEGQGALHYARSIYGNDHIREVTFASKRTLDDVTRHLQRPDSDEQTVVVDTVGEVHAKLLEEIGGVRPTIQNFGDVNTILERFIRSLRDMPVNLVLVAHEQIDDNDGESILRPATGGRKLPETVMAMMDVVGYCGVVAETDDSPRRFVAQLVQQRGRRAKDRSGRLGAVRDLDLAEWLGVWIERVAEEAGEFAVAAPVVAAEPEAQLDPILDAEVVDRIDEGRVEALTDIAKRAKNAGVKPGRIVMAMLSFGLPDRPSTLTDGIAGLTAEQADKMEAWLEEATEAALDAAEVAGAADALAEASAT